MRAMARGVVDGGVSNLITCRAGFEGVSADQTSDAVVAIPGKLRQRGVTCTDISIMIARSTHLKINYARWSDGERSCDIAFMSAGWGSCRRNVAAVV
ncbi:hypothetical protein AB0C74_11665 [Spirillospora sp. NPDC048832]